MKIWRWVLILLVLAVLIGCSKESWYEGFRSVRENECYKLQGMQRDECLRNADVRYNQYNKDRQEVVRGEFK